MTEVTLSTQNLKREFDKVRAGTTQQLKAIEHTLSYILFHFNSEENYNSCYAVTANKLTTYDSFLNWLDKFPDSVKQQLLNATWKCIRNQNTIIEFETRLTDDSGQLYIIVGSLQVLRKQGNEWLPC